MEVILAINPGSTSTKIAIYEDQTEKFVKEINHSVEALSQFTKIADQEAYRTKTVLEAVHESGYQLSQFTAVTGRGGLLKPLQAGTYLINDAMVKDAALGTFGDHASNLGCMIAMNIGRENNIPAYTTDPVSVDEWSENAKVTGIKEIRRVALDHPLNIRAVIRRHCEEQNLSFDHTNFVVAHLGGGVSVSAFQNGKLVDSNNANESGPFSATRSGTLPVMSVVNLCHQEGMTLKEVKTLFLKKAGLYSYLGTNDLKEVLKRIDQGETYAKFILDAWIYQISKEIGAVTAVLRGLVKAILLTGGMANSKLMVAGIISRVSFIAPIFVYPGGDELQALALAAYRANRGLETLLTY
ncbi:butyrate kinase [bacterium]|nr:butyrate kinase [bacterium]